MAGFGSGGKEVARNEDEDGTCRPSKHADGLDEEVSPGQIPPAPRRNSAEYGVVVRENQQDAEDTEEFETRIAVCLSGVFTENKAARVLSFDLRGI